MKDFIKKHKVLFIVFDTIIVLLVFLFIFRSIWINSIKDTVTAQISAITGTKVDVKDFTIYFLLAKVKIHEVYHVIFVKYDYPSMREMY